MVSESCDLIDKAGDLVLENRGKGVLINSNQAIDKNS